MNHQQLHKHLASKHAVPVSGYLHRQRNIVALKSSLGRELCRIKQQQRDKLK